MTTTSTPARFLPVRTRSGSTVHLAVSATSSVTACGSKVSGLMPEDAQVTCGRCTRTAEKIAARKAPAAPVEAPAVEVEEAPVDAELEAGMRSVGRVELRGHSVHSSGVKVPRTSVWPDRASAEAYATEQGFCDWKLVDTDPAIVAHAEELVRAQVAGRQGEEQGQPVDPAWVSPLGFLGVEVLADGRTILRETSAGERAEALDARAAEAGVGDLVEAREAKHAGKTIDAGVPTDRLVIRRQLLGYDVATPSYRWHLLVDGRNVGRWAKRRSELIRLARSRAEELLATADAPAETPQVATPAAVVAPVKRADAARTSGRVYASKLAAGQRVVLRGHGEVVVARVETWEPRKVLVTLATDGEPQLVLGSWAWVRLAA